jgi:hypothetical protein
LPINKTAFGIDKISIDYSQIHGLFSFDIPDKIFSVVEKINGVIYVRLTTDLSENAWAEDGELVCESGPALGDTTIIFSNRHVRLQPNRGIIFSPSIFVDSYNVSGAEIEYGIFNLNGTDIIDGVTAAYNINGYFMRVYSLGVRTYNEQIDPMKISLRDGTFDPSLGHLFDIQGQWRGVGDFYAWLSSPYDDDNHKVHERNFINKGAKLSVSNPAMHAGYIARNLGGVGRLRSGCLDVSIEGGTDEKQFPFYPKNSAAVTVPTTGKVTLVFKVPYTYRDTGLLNTRDIQLYEFSGLSDKKANFKVYITKEGDRLTKGAGLPIEESDWQYMPDGSCVQYIDNVSGLITGFDKENLFNFLDIDLEAGIPYVYKLPDPGRIPEWRTHGEYIIIEGYGATATMKNSASIGELI